MKAKKEKPALLNVRVVKPGCDDITYIPFIATTVSQSLPAKAVGIDGSILFCNVDLKTKHNQAKELRWRFDRTTGMALKGEAPGFLLNLRYLVPTPEVAEAFCAELGEVLDQFGSELDVRVRRTLYRIAKKPLPKPRDKKRTASPNTFLTQGITHGRRVSIVGHF